MGSDLSRTEFDRLMLEHMPKVHGFAIRLTGDPDVAEEVMQDALVRASRSWKTFQGRAQFSTWLIRIVTNTFRDRLRGSLRAEALPEEMPDKEAVDPASHMIADDVGEAVALAVASLPVRQREVLVLRTYEGLSTAEVADLVGLSEQNVRTNLHHARAALRRLLAPYLDGSQV